MGQMAEDGTDGIYFYTRIIRFILCHLFHLCSKPYFSDGMMIPRMITFWQKMNTRSVGIAVRTSAA